MGQLECAPSGKQAACGNESKRVRGGGDEEGPLKLICHYAKSLCAEENVCEQKWKQKKKGRATLIMLFDTLQLDVRLFEMPLCHYEVNGKRG